MGRSIQNEEVDSRQKIKVVTKVWKGCKRPNS